MYVLRLAVRLYRQVEGDASLAGRRSSILENLTQRFSIGGGLNRLSLGLSEALRRLSIGDSMLAHADSMPAAQVAAMHI